MVTHSQAASIRVLDAEEATRPFAVLATRALVFQDTDSAAKFTDAVLLALARIKQAWGEGMEAASKPEALLLANLLFLLRCVASRFPSLAGVVNTSQPQKPKTARPRRRRKPRKSE
jgi:hypothetical protein